ncbi:MAG: cellulase family glycosylhydrolase [Opitutaceae bacterium]
MANPNASSSGNAGPGLLFFWVALSLVAGAARADPPALPEASWDRLPAWHGFNLLEKFHLDWSNGPYKEEDFRMMAAYGFNFARLPMDYRTYIKGGDWLAFDEAILAEIDQAVAWGGEYGIHIDLNLHRIPGYTVASPAESTSLWTDPATQAAAAAHWRMFAERYRGIPNSRLSFNLLNEPAGMLTGTQYAAVVKILADAIREEDPDRLIIADGLDFATRSVPELIPLRVAQSKHGYEPFNLTHYQADWVDGSSSWPVPYWPGNGVSTYLYGPEKPEFRSAMVIAGPFERPVSLRIRVAVVSDRARLVVSGDEATLFDRVFEPGPGEGEWETVVYKEEWGLYQNTYNRDYLIDVPAGVSEIRIQNTEGDWLTLAQVGIREVEPDGPEAVLQPGAGDWGSRQDFVLTWGVDEAGPSLTAGGGDRADLWERHLQEWKDLEAQGVGVMVGEFGVYNRTPHPVVIAWLRDVLENYTIAGFGWSMWNFRGSFGPMNSDRDDVVYETVEGGLLDREMMDLLQEFAGHRENPSG